jgi:hypothetical protein
MSESRPVWGWLIVRMIPIVGGPVSEGMRKGVVADLAAGKRKGRLQFSSMDAAVAYGMGVLLMSVRTVLTGRMPKDFGETMAAMLLQGYGIQRDEACGIASLPLPFSPSEESPGTGEAIKIAESFDSHRTLRD